MLSPGGDLAESVCLLSPPRVDREHFIFGGGAGCSFLYFKGKESLPSFWRGKMGFWEILADVCYISVLRQFRFVVFLHLRAIDMIHRRKSGIPRGYRKICYSRIIVEYN